MNQVVIGLYDVYGYSRLPLNEIKMAWEQTVRDFVAKHLECPSADYDGQHVWATTDTWY